MIDVIGWLAGTCLMTSHIWVVLKTQMFDSFHFQWSVMQWECTHVVCCAAGDVTAPPHGSLQAVS